MRKILSCLTIAVFASFLAAGGTALAGPVGAALDQIGASSEAQNAGDTLYNGLTTWATKGEATRGASGAMGELVWNSGELICSGWIIGFRLRIRNMVIENHDLSGAEQSEHLQLIAQAMRFADLLEQECYRVGLLGEPEAAGATGGGAAGDGAAAAPEAPAPVTLLLPGETVADAICRRRCQPFLDRLDEANRELAEEEERRRQAEEDFKRKEARAEELRQEVRQLQQELDALPSAPTTVSDAGAAAARDQLLRRGHDLRRALQTAQDSLPAAEAAASAAQKQLALVASILADYRKAAQEAQARYDECLRSCLEQAAAAGDPTTTVCPEPAAHKPVSIGPNDKVGSSARGAQQLKKSLGGGALGGLLGGGGGTFGSKKANPVPNRAGSGAKTEPETADDPIDEDDKVAHTAGGTELAVGAMMTGGGLLVSAFIDEAPGDGTFQAVFLEDADGRRRTPDRYDIYDLWREWSLTVWWTRDRWVDGQHVSHEEGGWTESGRETAQLAVLRPSEAQEHGIWNRLGFSSAAKGVRSLGAQFAITAAELTRPVDLVIHTTLPEDDPVATQPLIYRLTADAAAAGGVALLPVANSLAVERGCY